MAQEDREHHFDIKPKDQDSLLAQLTPKLYEAGSQYDQVNVSALLAAQYGHCTDQLNQYVQQAQQEYLDLAQRVRELIEGRDNLYDYFSQTDEDYQHRFSKQMISRKPATSGDNDQYEEAYYAERFIDVLYLFAYRSDNFNELLDWFHERVLDDFLERQEKCENMIKVMKHLINNIDNDKQAIDILCEDPESPTTPILQSVAIQKNSEYRRDRELRRAEMERVIEKEEQLAQANRTLKVKKKLIVELEEQVERYSPKKMPQTDTVLKPQAENSSTSSSSGIPTHKPNKKPTSKSANTLNESTSHSPSTSEKKEYQQKSKKNEQDSFDAKIPLEDDVQTETNLFLTVTEVLDAMNKDATQSEYKVLNDYYITLLNLYLKAQDQKNHAQADKVEQLVKHFAPIAVLMNQLLNAAPEQKAMLAKDAANAAQEFFQQSYPLLKSNEAIPVTIGMVSVMAVLGAAAGIGVCSLLTPVLFVSAPLLTTTVAGIQVMSAVSASLLALICGGVTAKECHSRFFLPQQRLKAVKFETEALANRLLLSSRT